MICKMKMEVEEQFYDEDLGEWVKNTKTLNMPEELPGNVGDKANRKLDARIDMQQGANTSRGGDRNVKASTSIKSSQFQEVTEYLVDTMLEKFNRGDDVDKNSLTDSSRKKIAGHYFNQLQVFGSKKKDKN